MQKGDYVEVTGAEHLFMHGHSGEVMAVGGLVLVKFMGGPMGSYAEEELTVIESEPPSDADVEQLHRWIKGEIQ